ncbi:hypothetical protein NKI39_15695 [Mesorhizobium sp. M0664]|uniref:hypothetical protein n=1 Tax=Mesorhizobium sp. M0664 TaxID=2956982 RepID=UPI003335D5D4
MASFVQVQEILDKLVDYENIGMHGPFWRGKSRDEFVSLSIFGLPIISIGDSAESNLIKALRGLAPFGRNLDPRPPGARFNRMPSRRPPASEKDIATIERWINLGCPESLPDRRENREALLAASTVDIRFWREFDDFFLYKSSEQTKKYVFGFIGNSVPIWLDFALRDGSSDGWTKYIAQGPIRESIDYISKHQSRIVRSFYGSPAPSASVFDSFWKFGGNLLPDDPQSSGPTRHTMNSPADWFNWSPFLDSVLCIDGANPDSLLFARSWHVGLIADGLLRTDSDRPPSDRIKITDFRADDPNLFSAAVARYENADSSRLITEFARRVRESDVFPPAAV